MQKFRVATKANPWYKDGKTFDDPVAGLNAGSVKEQLRASLSSLRYASCPQELVSAHRTAVGDDLSTRRACPAWLMGYFALLRVS